MNSVAKSASGDRNTRDDKMPSRQIVAHHAQRNTKGGNNFRLLSPKTRSATEFAASFWVAQVGVQPTWAAQPQEASAESSCSPSEPPAAAPPR